ncbi:MAG TPA: hypothetical protein DHW71_02330 [Gammaproteobacteria bacterium]|nr:hypothetical protein [Gammaproteobacteria bacterium]MEC8010210.1 hypothetical protein [Pseudomonadota bacterium]HBF07790.1 hypothetical protein [Gammaproteobacteria bacterium]HCK91792.1 hypothetical protein [Gammaproteobacteria bacterium]|tara:strand:- start:440 stop:1279 length:840 start_codon:yes stop_codon:yes gene_type:complete
MTNTITPYFHFFLPKNQTNLSGRLSVIETSRENQVSRFSFSSVESNNICFSKINTKPIQACFAKLFNLVTNTITQHYKQLSQSLNSLLKPKPLSADAAAIKKLTTSLRSQHGVNENGFYFDNLDKRGNRAEVRVKGQSTTSLPDIYSLNNVGLLDNPSLESLPQNFDVDGQVRIVNCGIKAINSGNFYDDLRIESCPKLESFTIGGDSSINGRVTLRHLPELITLPSYFPKDLVIVNCPNIKADNHNKPFVQGDLYLSSKDKHLVDMFELSDTSNVYIS